MTAVRRIDFDDDVAMRTDRVTAVITPADAYSRSMVAGDVTVTLWDRAKARPLPDRLVQNLRGHHVLLNRPLDELYTFRVDPSAARYLGPTEVDFRPTEADREKVVWLFPSTDAVFPTDVTLLRGSVVVGNGDEPHAPAANVSITARPQEEVNPSRREDRAYLSETETDGRGGFVLPVRLPPVLGEEAAERVDFVITLLSPTGATRQLEPVKVKRGGRHVFASPIPLANSHQPQLIPGSKP